MLGELYMRIYSNKMENVVLWEGDIPDGYSELDIDSTDKNICDLFNKYFSELISDYDENSINYDQDVQYCSYQAWDYLWDFGNQELYDCYVWIK